MLQKFILSALICGGTVSSYASEVSDWQKAEKEMRNKVEWCAWNDFNSVALLSEKALFSSRQYCEELLHLTLQLIKNKIEKTTNIKTSDWDDAEYEIKEQINTCTWDRMNGLRQAGHIVSQSDLENYTELCGEPFELTMELIRKERE